MGKMVLSLVVGMGILAGISNVNISQRALTATNTSSSAFAKTIAQNIANSAVEIGLSRMTLMPAWTDGWTRKSISQGYSQLTVTKVSKSRTRLISVGVFNGQTHTVKVIADRADPGPYLEAALTIVNDQITPTFAGNKVLINGNDTKLDGSAGTADPVYGIAVPTDAIAADFISNIKDKTKDQVLGLGGWPSVSQFKKSWDIPALADQWKQHADLTLTDTKYAGNDVWGTITVPKIVYSDHSIEIAGNIRGAGILIINGDAKFDGNFDWKGIIICTGTQSFVVDGNPSILGGVLIAGTGSDGSSLEVEDPNDPGLPGGHFDVDVFVPSNNRLFHQHAWDDKYGPELDILNNRLLLWSRVIGTKQDLRLRFRETEMISGTYMMKGFLTNGSPFDLNFKSSNFNKNGSTDYTVLDHIKTFSVFKIIPDNLYVMNPTEPGTVQKDASLRAGSFTAFLYDQAGNIVWEFPLYWHKKDDKSKSSSGSNSSSNSGSNSNGGSSSGCNEDKSDKDDDKDKSDKGKEKDKSDKDDDTVDCDKKTNVIIKGSVEIKYSEETINTVLANLNLVRWKMTSYYE